MHYDAVCRPDTSATSTCLVAKLSEILGKQDDTPTHTLKEATHGSWNNHWRKENPRFSLSIRNHHDMAKSCKNILGTASFIGAAFVRRRNGSHRTSTQLLHPFPSLNHFENFSMKMIWFKISSKKMEAYIESTRSIKHPIARAQKEFQWLWGIFCTSYINYWRLKWCVETW